MKTPRILVIDTSTRYGGVAVSEDGRLLAERFFMAERTIAARLPSLVEQTIADAGITLKDLHGIGVVAGPGSFTGVRVGVAAAKGMAYALGIPVVPCSSLTLLAMNFPHASTPVCAMLDARKGEVYACRYDVGCLPLPITEEAAIAPRCLVSHITAPTIFAGEGALVYRELLVTSLGELAIIPDPVFHLPRPGHIIPLVAKLFSAGEGQRPEETLPVYLRQSEAELARRNTVLDAGDSG